MSANAESQTPQQPVKKRGKRKGLLLLLTLLFVVIAVAYGIYWFLVLRHFEETDDAYVAGNQVQIMLTNTALRTREQTTSILLSISVFIISAELLSIIG